MSLQRYNRRQIGRAAGGGLAAYMAPGFARWGARQLGRVANSNSAAQMVSRARDLITSNLRSGKRADRLSARRLRGTSSVSIGKQVPAGGGGESKSFFSLVRPKISVPKTCHPQSVNRSSGFSSASTQGRQNVVNVGSYFSATDVQNCFTSLGMTAGTATYNAARIYILECRAKAFITNSETTNVHFTIYEVLQKNDTGALNIDPASTFAAGFVDAAGGATTDAGVPGTSPFENPRFIQAYSILKQTPIILSPGQTHVHNVTYNPNKMYSHERDLIMGTTTGGIGGITIHSFIVQHGTPVHDDVTETLVTIGASKLDIVLTEAIKWKITDRNYAFNSISTTLATNLAGFQMNENQPTDAADGS